MRMTQSATPKVSVIISTYNRAALLPRAVNSVLTQTFQNYEIIIVDDCSPDNTQDVITAFSDPRIRSVRHETNRRQSAAINTGIANSRGEYIAFLDDDDEWLPAKLEWQVALLDTSPAKVGLVYGWLNFVEDSSGRIIEGPRKTMNGNIMEELIAFDFPGPTSTLLVRTSIAREVGGFDEYLPIGKDADFICRIAKRCDVAVYPKVVMKYHIGHGYNRISDITSYGLRNQLRFIEAHMANFAKELDSNPQAHAIILRRRATIEMTRGNLYGALSAFFSALRIHPSGVTHAVFANRRFVSRMFILLIRKKISI